MRPTPEIITYLATAACFGFGFYAVAWLIFAAFKYADTADDRTDQRAHGDQPFVPPGLAASSFHSPSISAEARHDHGQS